MFNLQYVWEIESQKLKKRSLKHRQYVHASWLGSPHYSMFHNVLTASEGIRQSPRGDSDTDPTFGPSGMQERLNCCWKNLRMNVFSQYLIVSLSYLPSKAFCANRYIFSDENPNRMK